MHRDTNYHRETELTTQQSLFNSALRQSNTIRKELTPLSEAPSTCTPAKQGELNASLSSFSRTIDDYNRLAKQEIVPEKQEKAFGRVKTFRTDLEDYRLQLEKLKKAREEAVRRWTEKILITPCPDLLVLATNPESNRVTGSTTSQCSYARKSLCQHDPNSSTELSIPTYEPLSIGCFTPRSNPRDACLSRAVVRPASQCAARRVSRTRTKCARRLGPTAGDAQGHTTETIQCRQHARDKRRHHQDG